jgi:hypothetical protein
MAFSGIGVCEFSGIGVREKAAATRPTLSLPQKPVFNSVMHSDAEEIKSAEGAPQPSWRLVDLVEETSRWVGIFRL